jgi:hypothetical protein
MHCNKSYLNLATEHKVMPFQNSHSKINNNTAVILSSKVFLQLVQCAPATCTMRTHGVASKFPVIIGGCLNEDQF